MSQLVAATENPYQLHLDNPPRLQWEANYGYCGEVSFVSANLRYGQYLSQYDARKIASKGKPQSKEGSQLLLGVNDMYAATQMHLKASQWDNSDAPNAGDFLAWVKDGIIANSSVIMSAYTNEYLFYGKTNTNAGDAEYDHIVPVIGVSSKYPLTAPAVYHPDDTITFSDNGLYTPNGKATFIYEYSDGSFQRNRQQANDKNSPPYSLPSSINYGIAISGIVDNDGQTLPVSISTNLNYEKPAMKDGSNSRPAPENLTLTVTVNSLQPGKAYNLYRYNDFSKVPESSFNANKGQAAESWQIQTSVNSTYTRTQTILSNQTAIYRAVSASAP